MNQGLLESDKAITKLPVAIAVDCERIAHAALAVAVQGIYCGQQFSNGNLSACDPDGFLPALRCLAVSIGETPERITPTNCDYVAARYLGEVAFYAQAIITTFENRLSLDVSQPVNRDDFQNVIRDEFQNGHFHKLREYARLLGGNPNTTEVDDPRIAQAIAAGLRALADDKHISAGKLWARIAKEVAMSVEWVRKKLKFDHKTKSLSRQP